MGSRSNLGRCLQIGRPRVKGARGGGGRSPEQSSAVGAAPEYAVSSVPGAIWDGVWPWSTIAAWVIHWRCNTLIQILVFNNKFNWLYLIF